MTTATKLFEGSITGLNTDGEVITTFVAVEPNSDWTPETADDEYRFRVVSLVDDEEQDSEDFDDLADANTYAKELLEDAAAAIEDAEKSLRDEHSEAVADLADGWHPGDDRELAERIADLISDGDAGKALAALKAAGLI